MIAVGGQDKLPQSLLLFGHNALFQHLLEILCGVGGRQSMDQLVIDILDEIDQERGHIHHSADPGILLCQRIGVVITPAAFFHILRQWNKQSRGIALLHQIP